MEETAQFSLLLLFKIPNLFLTYLILSYSTQTSQNSNSDWNLVNDFTNLDRVDIWWHRVILFRILLCLSINSDHALCFSVKFYSFIQISTMLAKFIHRYFIVFTTLVNGPPLLPLSFLTDIFNIEWSLIYCFYNSCYSRTTYLSSFLQIVWGMPPPNVSLILTRNRGLQTMLLRHWELWNE